MNGPATGNGYCDHTMLYAGDNPTLMATTSLRLKCALPPPPGVTLGDPIWVYPPRGGAFDGYSSDFFGWCNPYGGFAGFLLVRDSDNVVVYDTAVGAAGMPDTSTYGAASGKPGGCNSAGADKHVNHVGDPVNTAIGAFVDSVVDFELPGAGVTCGFSRAYTSADTTPGPLGVGWTHRYNASLVFASNGDATFRAEDGQQVLFSKQQDGSFTPAHGVRSRLAAVAGGGYRLTVPGQRFLVFNAAGQLTSITDRLGQGLTLAYSAGQLATVTDAAGRVATLSYIGGLLDRVSLPDGRFVGYGYAGGRLTTVRDLRGKTTTYTYDGGGLLQSATDPLGHRAYFNTYDGATGRVTSQLDAANKLTTFTWNPATNTSVSTDPRGGQWTDVYYGNVLTRQTDPLGDTPSYQYDAGLNVYALTDARGNTTSMTYDAAGNMLSRSAPAPLSYVERWTYNSDNQVLTHTDGRGNVVLSNVYDPATGLLTSVTDGESGVTSFAYNTRGQVTSVTDPRGKVTAFGYDADGNRTSVTSPLAEKTTMSYDASGRLLFTVDPRGNVSGGTPSAFQTSFGYDAGNLVTSTTDARGKTTAFGFDDAGRAVSSTDALAHATSVGYDAVDRPVSVTDASGAVTSTVYDETGNPLSVTTPAGTTSYTYDLAGRVASRVDPRGNVTGATASAFTWTFTHDPNGNVTSVSHPTAGTTSTVYDALNRPTSTTDALNRTSSTVYDADSNVTSVTDPLSRTVSYVYDKNNRLTAQTDARGKTTGYGYDAAGNRTSMTSPLGEKTTWTFDDDGRPATVVDPRGNVTGGTPATFRTSFGYDPAGQRTSVTDPLGKVTASGFDAVGNLISATDANLHATAYSYDAVNRLASVRGADTALTSYGYDLVGNLTSRTDANTHVTAYTYDGAHRMTSLLSPIGQRWTFAYDADGNRTSTVTAAGNATPAVGDGQIDASFDALGRQTAINYSDATPDVAFSYDQLRRTSMTDGAGTESYGYDAADQLTGVTRGASGFAYQYDLNGQVAKRTYPDGTVVDIARDSDGRMSSVTSGGAVTSYAYDAAGNLLTTTLPAANGYVETRTVDAAGRLAQVSNTKGASVLSRFAVARDPAGNPLSVTTTRGSTTSAEAYSYDVADRLAKVCYAASCAGTPPSIGYTYDGVGNRLTEKRQAAPVPASNAVGPLVNVGGLCAAVQGASTAANTPVVLATCSGAASQQWTAGADGTLRSLGKCLEVASTATANGSVARINTCAVTVPYQRWTALDNGQLVGASSGRCLKVNGAAGTQLVVFDCGTTAALRWQAPVRPARTATGQAWNLAAPKMCVTAAGSGANAAVNYAACDTATGKQWTAMADGTMRALGVCMELPSGVTANGTPVRVNACSALAHQRWSAKPDGTLVHEASGRCLSVNGTQTQLIVSTCTAATAQVWSLPVVSVVTGYSYNTADQLTSTVADGTARAYSYDPNGNQTAAGGVTSTFDLANRTATTVSGPTTTGYSYDGLGKRLTASTNGTVSTRFSWDANSALPMLASESTGAGALIRRYVNGFDGPISLTAGAATSYYHRDAYGSISDVTSAAGAAQWSYAYEPFGAARSTTKVDSAAPANPMQYTGQYLDSTTGQYHLRARQYDPAAGRFTATDPLAPPITDLYVSAYAYVGNLPTVFGDPDGMRRCGLFRGTVCDSLDFAKGEVIGAAKFAVVTGKSAYVMATNPVQAGRQMYVACALGSRQHGGGIDGTAGCIDNLNPIAAIRKDAAEAWRLAEKGCYEKAGEHAGGALAATGLTVAPFAKGAPLPALEGDAGAAAAAESEAGVAGQEAEGSGLSKVCNCFPAGTKVATEQGEKPIEKIDVGDKVWAQDLSSGKRELRTVTGLFSKHTDELMDITVAGTVVTVTSKHPFYVPGRGWVMSGDLKVGDRLQQRNGHVVAVTKIRHYAANTTVYNFAVEGDHNYYIGEAQLLVHNCPAKGGGANDAPSWVAREAGPPLPGETAQQFATRILDQKYGAGSWTTGAGSEFSKIVKWVTRGRRLQ